MTLTEQREDTRRAWALAVEEMRRQGIREGRYQPTDEERKDMDIEVALVARTEEIGDWVLQCARRELSFDDLCSRVAARGYRTTSLYEMVCAAEQAESRAARGGQTT